MYHFIKKITSYTKGDIYENRIVSQEIIAVKFGDDSVKTAFEGITKRLNDSRNFDERNTYTVEYELGSASGELRNLEIDSSDEDFATIALMEVCHKEIFSFMGNELSTYHSRGKKLPQPRNRDGAGFKYLDDAITCLFLKCYNCRELTRDKVEEIVMESIRNGLVLENDIYDNVYVKKKEDFDLMAAEKNINIKK